jgi:hypothetical protein
MTTSPHDQDRLEQLGDALHAAAAADLSRGATARVPPRRRRHRGKIAAAAVVALVAVPGAAIGANALIGSDEVERSIPNGTLALLGTHPTCIVVREGVEFDCRLQTAPRGELEPGTWKGTVEPTVDDAKRVNGGCRSLNGEGTNWRCYIGEEAVRQQIVGPALLGEYSSWPGVG